MHAMADAQDGRSSMPPASGSSQTRPEARASSCQFLSNTLIPLDQQPLTGEGEESVRISSPRQTVPAGQAASALLLGGEATKPGRARSWPL